MERRESWRMLLYFFVVGMGVAQGTRLCWENEETGVPRNATAKKHEITMDEIMLILLPCLRVAAIVGVIIYSSCITSVFTDASKCLLWF